MGANFQFGPIFRANDDLNFKITNEIAGNSLYGSHIRNFLCCFVIESQIDVWFMGIIVMHIQNCIFPFLSVLKLVQKTKSEFLTFRQQNAWLGQRVLPSAEALPDGTYSWAEEVAVTPPPTISHQVRI